MARSIREYDWTATPLGPVARWPERLKTVVEIVLANGFPMAVLWGPDLVQIYNDAHCALLGANHAAALGRPLRQTSPEFWRSNLPIYERVQAGDTVTTADVIFPPERGTPGGPRFTQSCSPLRGSEGIAVVGILVTLVETTAGERAETVRRRAERAMRASEERLRIANEVGRLAVWDWDIQSGELSWSEEHFRMLGYAVGEVPPSYQAWASRIHPDEKAETEAALAVARSGGGAYVREFRTLHPDGTVRWLSARGQFFYDEQDNAIRMVGAMADVTERRELEERQRVLVAELQHRTRNLIGVVRSIAQQTMAQAEPSDAFRMQFNERLSALSRVQGLLSQASEERIAIGHLVRLELDAFGAKNFGERIALDGPEVRLRNSVVQTLALAVHELATNARKHGALATEEGRLKIAWAVDEAEGEGRRLRLEWLEHGIAQPAQQGAPKLGYGRELIEKALPYSLGAKTSFKLSRDQLRCTIDLPLDRPDSANGDVDGLF